MQSAARMANGQRRLASRSWNIMPKLRVLRGGGGGIGILVVVCVGVMSGASACSMAVYWPSGDGWMCRDRNARLGTAPLSANDCHDTP